METQPWQIFHHLFKILLCYSYEEADTGMVLHALNESKKDSFTFTV